MKTPFVFGRIATDDNFTDREDETNFLLTQFSSLINTILISPRRWGKSSLVDKASRIALSQNPDLRICHIDLFNVRNEEEFYVTLASEILKATSSRWEEAVNNAKVFLSGLMPKISISADPSNEVSLDFGWDQAMKSPDDILDLAEKIAIEKRLRIVICIDEFQNISEFANPDAFQKKLRTHWQRHQHVAYCLYGSKRHMMLEVFTDSSKPFYKFGNLMFLNKISTTNLVDFFKTQFKNTQKDITDHAARLIVSLVDNHPYYAQQLAQSSWLRTSSLCTDEIVMEAHSALVGQLSLLFINMTESLSSQQLNYLKALLYEEKALTSTSIMKKYGITSATSVARSKAALVKNDILDVIGNKVSFQDPIYAYWLRHEYFRIHRAMN